MIQVPRAEDNPAFSVAIGINGMQGLAKVLVKSPLVVVENKVREGQ